MLHGLLPQFDPVTKTVIVMLVVFNPHCACVSSVRKYAATLVLTEMAPKNISDQIPRSLLNLFLPNPHFTFYIPLKF